MTPHEFFGYLTDPTFSVVVVVVVLGWVAMEALLHE